MRFKNLYIIIFLLGLFQNVMGQEQLIELQLDPELNNYYRSHQILWKDSEINDPMFLPFFDDFNQAEYRPDAKLWIGDNVYVNKRYQLFPPDLGVATFDAMDGSGNIHSNANQFAFAADTLSSQPIRLDSIMDPVLRPLLIKDSIYLSFYYQPQGRGNAPEEADKLNLEFYSPAVNQWYPVWSSEGMTLSQFYNQYGVFSLMVMIPITDSALYFHKDFRFRFHNYASLAGNNQPDWQSNADHWNVDLVFLDMNRTVMDSSYQKIAFVNQPPSMIKRYQSMPYRQYRNDPTNSMKDTIHSILISNLNNSSYLATYKYKISNQSIQDSVYNGGTYTVFPFADSGYVKKSRFRDPRVISYFSIYNATRMTYHITHIVNDYGLTGVGDTAVRIQEFANYYAYDDGTPEAGYGFSVGNSRAAMKFKLNTKDTLRQIQFYFNPTLTMANDTYFDIMIWKNIDPEEVIYTKRVKTQFADGLYNFYTYDLDTSLVLANEFYVGFRQIYNENLSLGFDYATDSKEYLFYNIGDGWKSSIFSGSMMIRPVFGEKMSTAIQDIEEEDNAFVIYPNPLLNDYLHIDIGENDQQNFDIEIYSITGQKVLYSNFETSIDVSALKNGIYFVRLRQLTNGESFTQKLIINRR